MKLSELIKALEKLAEEHGDVEVFTQTMSHKWGPDPEIRSNFNETAKYVLLNP